MALNSKPIIFKITEAGRLAALDANKNGISLSLKTLAVGTSRYQATGKETSLKQEVARTPVISSGVEKQSGTLRFSASLNSPTTRNIFEVGLLTSDNKLFAIASDYLNDLFTIHANVTFVGSFGLSLDGIDADNIKVVVDPDSSIALKVVEDHVAAPNPHPQYANSKSFNDLKSTVDSVSRATDKNNADFQAHLRATNPHAQYLLKTQHDAHVKEYQALKKVVDDHTKQISDQKTAFEGHLKHADPHTQYAKKTDLSAHTSATHPHTQYLRDSDLAAMRKQIEDLQKLVKVAQDKITELPVGAIFTTTTNYRSSAEVAKALGYGTWSRFAEGRTLVGISTKSADPTWTKTLRSEFGAYTHKLTIAEMPSTALKVREAGRHGAREHKGGGTGYASGREGKMIPLPTSETGWQDQPHNNVQPSTVVAHWLRTA